MPTIRRSPEIFKSGFLPRSLGILIQIAGLCYVTNSLSFLVAPAFQGRIFPAILLPAFIGESSVCLWLLINGVNVEAGASARLRNVFRDAMHGVLDCTSPRGAAIKAVGVLICVSAPSLSQAGSSGVRCWGRLQHVRNCGRRAFDGQSAHARWR